jgi:hypothetical protein
MQAMLARMERPVLEAMTATTEPRDHKVGELYVHIPMYVHIPIFLLSLMKLAQLDDSLPQLDDS